MGPDGGFITGSDFLMDGGVTAAFRFGDLAPSSTRLSSVVAGGAHAYTKCGTAFWH